MNELPAKYNPSEVEDKLYAYWLENGLFRSTPDEREAYCIVIPPPNVTGVLHMGHMLNNTIQDVLVRRARMIGKNACWVPGTDHASIATEAKVVAKLKEQGIDKASLTRDEFLKHAWEWKEKHGGIILEQLKKLGASCDWSRTRFTMDPEMSQAVIDAFIHLYRRGLIYRGVRMVNWDPAGKTAVSDEEVIRKEVDSKLYYLSYPLSDGAGEVIVATTRPETIMADVAICVHPDDERYSALHGKYVLIPLIDRKIPIILDEYVTRDFGTGCLKITPAHDLNDYEIGLKHKLPVIDILNDDGTLNSAAQILTGEDRFVARKKIVRMLEEAGRLSKTEDYKSSVGFSERTDAVIEPRLSLQWFLKMEELAAPALKDVIDESIKLIPDKFKNTYRHWMENVRDWCISRQLWWGQRIPAWYKADGTFLEVGKTAQEALSAAESAGIDCSGIRADMLKQDEDVVDTWFSSWLWPISVFDPSVFADPQKKGNRDLNYYYPTDDLITAPEILFFWVARMIMAGHEFRGKKPFSTVYLTGIVRDKLGRKMSKSLGNSPDPLSLIAKYSADGVRMGMLLCSAAGNDILFDESQVEQGRNFCNKIWNAFRLVKSWQTSDRPQPQHALKAVEWFEMLLNKTIAEVADDFRKYRISEALMALYKLFWDDFCGRYLELIKPDFGSPIDEESYRSSLRFFDKMLKLLHPFMPFITEEIWLHLDQRKSGESIMMCRQPEATAFDETKIEAFEQAMNCVSEVRNIRKDKNIPHKTALELYIKGHFDDSLICVLSRAVNLSEVKRVELRPEGAASSFMLGVTEFFVPLGNLLNVEDELKKLKSELQYFQGFRDSVNRKLSNEKFVSGAPAQVVDVERKKLADAETKIKAIEEQIASLELG
ncbi:MAG: valine--tRNA ligase [Prevotellaceae bacterium]|nr:valine--tRNA ligase [Prevotellaceae bacterium]